MPQQEPTLRDEEAVPLCRPASRAIVLRIRGRGLLRADTLEALCRAGSDLRDEGVRLVVVCRDDRVRRLLTLAGFARRFDLVSSIDRDLAASLEADAAAA